jgi:hypothetical protein
MLEGTLSILVRPLGSIYIDGKLHRSDFDRQYTTKLMIGEHRVLLRHDMLGAKWEKYIKIQENEKKEIKVDFNKEVKITVVSDPINAQIIVDEQTTNRYTPSEIMLRVGLHTIGVRLEGYVLKGGEKTLNLEYDLNEPIKFELRKR